MLGSWLLCSLFPDQKLEPIEQLKILDLICWGVLYDRFWATCIVSVHHYNHMRRMSLLSPCLNEEPEAMGLNSTPQITGLISHMIGNLGLSFLFYFIGKSKPRFGAKVCQVPSFAENSALISRCGNQGKPCHSCKAKLWLPTRLPSVIKCNLKDAATKADTTATLEKWNRGQASLPLHYVCC